MSGFQTQVGYKQAPAVEGDFASVNTTIFSVASEQQMLAGPNGVTVARFAYMDYATGIVTNAKVTGGLLMFVHRENNAMILGSDEASMLIKTGFPVAGFNGGEFWVKVAAPVVAGTKVFADDVTGAAGTTGTETNFIFRTNAAAGELAKISSWGV
jgi:hypothetical protein